MNKVLVFLITIIPGILIGQGDLKTNMSKLQDLVGEVQVGKDMYDQEFTFSTERPYELEVAIIQTDSKGRSESETLSWNLAHIEANLVKWDDGRDMIKVVMGTGRKDYIRKYTDGEIDGYESEVVFLAKDIDNARAIVTLIKESVPMAVKAWETDSDFPESYDALKTWVSNQIKEVSIEEDRYTQKWNFASDHHSRLSFVQQKDGDRPEDSEYQFNLADINPNDLAVKIRGELIMLELSTAGNKRFIKVVENGEVGNYASDASILFGDIDEALETSHALKALVKLAIDKQKEYFKAPADRSAAISGIQESTGEFNVNGTGYKLSFTDDCLVDYTALVQSEKGDVESLYRFNWVDLDKESVEIKVRGKEVALEVKAKGRNDYIYYAKDGEQQNYEDGLLIPMSDIPSSRMLQHYIKAAIESCPTEVQLKDWTWLKDEINSGAVTQPNVTQSAEQIDGDPCKWSIDIMESGKRTDEEKYEFNLYDINPKALKLNISGKKVLVSMETLGRAEIIQNYSNSEELGYVNSISFEVKDVATGKIMISSIEHLLEGCVGK